jgi:hypothetical protein
VSVAVEARIEWQGWVTNPFWSSFQTHLQTCCERPVAVLLSTRTYQFHHASTLTALAQAAVAIPTVEQGLSVNSLSGIRWGNVEKGATLEVYREALSQCTLSWSRVQDDVDALDQALGNITLGDAPESVKDGVIERLQGLRLGV